MNLPSPVITMFMSVSARESSSYGRSRRGWPSMMPTETAASEPVSAFSTPSFFTASASAT